MSSVESKEIAQKLSPEKYSRIREEKQKIANEKLQFIIPHARDSIALLKPTLKLKNFLLFVEEFYRILLAPVKVPTRFMRIQKEETIKNKTDCNIKQKFRSTGNNSVTDLLTNQRSYLIIAKVAKFRSHPK
ncbi:hypothetical protein PGB90_007589 [Kerria lacca]